MRSFLILIVVGMLLAVGGLAYFMIQNVATDRPATTPTGVTSFESTGETDEPSVAGKYVSFTESALANSSGRRVLFFYANWCPTCRPADTNIQANEGRLPTDLTVFRVNYNDSDTDAAEKALAQKYGVTYQHTFVQINTDGAEIAKWNGGALPELLENIK